MSVINITNVQVLDNPSKFTNPFQFEITFECIAELKEDLEFKLIYVGSAESDSFDQVLDSILVGPVPVGVVRIVFPAEPPKPELIPPSDIVGVTVVLLTCSYRSNEFVRVGYYVNNDYMDEALRENPPPTCQVDKLYRNILADKPRVTRFSITWDNEPEAVATPDLTEEERAVASKWEELERVGATEGPVAMLEDAIAGAMGNDQPEAEDEDDDDEDDEDDEDEVDDDNAVEEEDILDEDDGMGVGASGVGAAGGDGMDVDEISVNPIQVDAHPDPAKFSFAAEEITMS